MKNVLIVIFSFIALNTVAQEVEFDGHKWEAPYHLSTPKGWAIERFRIPISFAPEINYKGVEDIRFTPGWANSKSEEYWTYAFLWYLDSLPKTDARIIEANLRAYYTGLIKVNSGNKIPPEKQIPVMTAFKETQTNKEDLQTYSGTVEMLDYMQQKPIKLNCMVHLRYCAAEKKAFMFYELSPQPFTHNTWQVLDQLWLDFKCKK